MTIVFKPRALGFFRKERTGAGSNASCAALDGNTHRLRRIVIRTGRSDAFSARLRVAARVLTRDVIAGARRIIREAATELARINRAGLRADAFAGKSRGDRARIVAASLSRRHKGNHRCC
jgi:hypothetical protein